MEEESNQKYSLVTGEKIKKKSVREIKLDHANLKRAEKREKRKLNRKIDRIDKQLHVVDNESGVVDNDEKTNQTKVLIVRKTEKGEPVSLKRKILNLLSYALVGLVAIVFGYFSGTFYIANVLNKVDFSAFSEQGLRDNGEEVYNKVVSLDIESQSAIELFVATEYLFSLETNYYIDVVGSIQPSIGSEQKVWGFKERKENTITGEQVSMGMLSVGERSVYDVESKISSIYKAKSFSGKTAKYEDTATELSYDEYRDIYGIDPENPVIAYIVSSKTVIEGTESVTKLGANRYQLNFSLTTDSSVLNYVKQQKHMSGLKDYPNFKMVNITAVIEVNQSNNGKEFKFVSIRSDESYTVMYFGVMATCSGYVENKFTY